MFDQPELERLLRDALARRPECELRGGAEVTARRPGQPTGRSACTYRDDEGEHHLWADAVLGCDGASSVTRDAVGAGWEDLRFEERWTVVDVRTSAAGPLLGGRRPGLRPAPAGDLHAHRRGPLPLGVPAAGRRRNSDHERLRELVAPWVDISRGDDFDVIRQARVHLPGPDRRSLAPGPGLPPR